MKPPKPPVMGIDGLNQMLRDARRATGSDAIHHVVMGNESADLDSMVSALMYAYYLFNTQPAADCGPIPVMNIPRADFKLRKDVAYLFRKTGIDIPDLTFGDEIDLAGLNARNKLRLSLVDHHHLAESQSHLSNAVVAILDHHPQTVFIPDAVRCQIEPVGSTATLVAEKFQARRPDVLDASLAGLLLSTIIVDTVKLDPQKKKATAQDRAVAQWLNEKWPLDFDRRHDKLAGLKSDVSGLSADQMLRKDFKALRLGETVCGISSVPLSLDAWMNSLDDSQSAVRSFARSRELDLFLIMLFQRKPYFKRQLAAYSEDLSLLERTIAILTDHGVQLTPVPCGAAVDHPKSRLHCFDQTDPHISRKIVIKTLHAGLQH